VFLRPLPVAMLALRAVLLTALGSTLVAFALVIGPQGFYQEKLRPRRRDVLEDLIQEVPDVLATLRLRLL
jgi:hypothetical protein